MTEDMGTPEDRLEDLLDAGGMALFSNEVRDDVERLLASGQALEPDTRAALITAASRGVRHLRLDRHPIELGLFRLRQENEIDLLTIAATSGVSVDLLRAIERGTRPITQLKAEAVAAWASAVHMDAALAKPALRLSLAASANVRAYSGSAEVRLSDEHEQFVAQVVAALERRPTSSEQD